jgi:hypothetical protein
MAATSVRSRPPRSWAERNPVDLRGALIMRRNCNASAFRVSRSNGRFSPSPSTLLRPRHLRPGSTRCRSSQCCGSSAAQFGSRRVVQLPARDVVSTMHTTYTNAHLHASPVCRPMAEPTLISAAIPQHLVGKTIRFDTRQLREGITYRVRRHMPTLGARRTTPLLPASRTMRRRPHLRRVARRHTDDSTQIDVTAAGFSSGDHCEGDVAALLDAKLR